jgi:hypothetical protein
VAQLTSTGNRVAPNRTAEASWLVVFARVVSMVLALFDCWREIRAASRWESRETAYRALRLRDASTSVGKCVRLVVRVRGEVPKKPCVICNSYDLI